MRNQDSFYTALSHWLIEPRPIAAMSRSGTRPLRRLIVAADSAASARQYAEHWRMSRPYDIAGPFTDQHHYLVRRLPDHAVGDLRSGAGKGVVHSELAQA